MVSQCQLFWLPSEPLEFALKLPCCISRLAEGEKLLTSEQKLACYYYFLLWPSILSDSVVKTHWLLIINCETSTILLIKSPWQQGLWWVILVHSAHVVAPMWKVFKLLNSTCWREEGNERRWCSLLLLLLEKLKTMLDSGGCDKVL